MSAVIEWLADSLFAGSIVILIVLLIRGVILRKMPRRYAYLLWAVVAVRLICPVSIQSPLSVFNYVPEVNLVQESGLQKKDVPLTDLKAQSDRVSEGKTGERLRQADRQSTQQSVRSGRQSVQSAQTVPISEAYREEKETSAVTPTINEQETRETSVTQDATAAAGASPVFPILFLLWAIGVGTFLLKNIIDGVKLHNRLRTAVILEKGVYESDQIDTPFVKGIIRPRIYIPFRLSEQEKTCILAHEKHHIRRGDPIFKLLATMLLALFWFHPLVWVSYRLMVRDMEMSCDEYVLTHETSDIRAAYSTLLLAFATNQRIADGVLFFGENDTKQRVKHILGFRKKHVALGLIAILVVVLTSACTLTGKAADSEDTDTANGQAVSGKAVSGGAVDDQELEQLPPPSEYFCKQVLNGCSTVYIYSKDDRYIGDELSPHNGMYEGTFFIDVYQGEKRTDSCVFALNDNTTNWFHKDFKLSTVDYNGDGRDDFALGSYLSSNLYEYRFYSVDEDGRMLMLLNHEGTPVIINATPNGESPEFDHKGQTVYYSYFDNVAGDREDQLLVFSRTTMRAGESSSTTANEGEEIPITEAVHAPEDSMGSDMPELLYVDDTYLILRTYKGLFIYDKVKKAMHHSVDLTTIHCAAMQGDEYAAVFATEDGKIVYMDDIQNKVQYEYLVDEHKLLRLSSYVENLRDQTRVFDNYDDVVSDEAFYISGDTHETIYVRIIWEGECRMGDVAYFESKEDGPTEDFPDPLKPRYIFREGEYERTDVTKYLSYDVGQVRNQDGEKVGDWGNPGEDFTMDIIVKDIKGDKLYFYPATSDTDIYRYHQDMTGTGYVGIPYEGRITLSPEATFKIQKKKVNSAGLYVPVKATREELIERLSKYGKVKKCTNPVKWTGDVHYEGLYFTIVVKDGACVELNEGFGY